MDDVWIPARIASVRDETPIDRTFSFEVSDADRRAFRWRPGFHTVLRIPDEAPPAARPYSLSGADGGGRPIRITVRGSGSWGRPVYELNRGARVELATPRGRFDLAVPSGYDTVLVAGGSGVTPFRAFVEDWILHAAPGRVTLLLSARDSSQVLFRDEWDAWQRARSAFRWTPTLTREPASSAWSGARGRIDEARLAAAIEVPERTIVAACGPRGLVSDAIEWARRVGVADDAVRRESW